VILFACSDGELNLRNQTDEECDQPARFLSNELQGGKIEGDFHRLLETFGLASGAGYDKRLLNDGTTEDVQYHRTTSVS
jgi:hypothetical protein